MRNISLALLDGQKCNHFFFLQPPGIELELWSEADERALPRRIAITYRSIPGEPQFLSLIGYRIDDTSLCEVGAFRAGLLPSVS
jgi:hypothetical protein